MTFLVRLSQAASLYHAVHSFCFASRSTNSVLVLAIAKYKPQDATTNPSLILAASKKEEYAKLIDAAVAVGKKHNGSIDEQVDVTLDILLVEFGREILKIVPGRVSTEVDASLSFDTKGSVDKALKIIDVSNGRFITCTFFFKKKARRAQANLVFISPRTSCTRSRALVRSAF